MFKRNENLHAALDWEVMFLTEFSTWKLTIPERKKYEEKETLYIILYLLLFYIIFNLIFVFILYYI